MTMPLWLPQGTILLLVHQNLSPVSVDLINVVAQSLPWRRKWQPTPVFLLREFHGQRCLVVYNVWGHKELDMTEWLTHFQSLSLQLFETPWTIAHQAPLSMGFSREEYWSELPRPPPRDLPDLGTELASHTSPALAAAKSLQSCPTLCDPIDRSPPGSSVPGILQASTLEWVAISFSSAWKWEVKVKLLSRVRLLVAPWTVAYQAPPSMGYSRQEYWSGVPLPSPN